MGNGLRAPTRFSVPAIHFQWQRQSPISRGPYPGPLAPFACMAQASSQLSTIRESTTPPIGPRTYKLTVWVGRVVHFPPQSSVACTRVHASCARVPVAEEGVNSGALRMCGRAPAEPVPAAQWSVGQAHTATVGPSSTPFLTMDPVRPHVHLFICMRRPQRSYAS